MKSAFAKLILFTVILGFFSACKNSVTNYNVELEVPVSVKEIVPESIESYINSTGTVFPMKEVTLTSEMAGMYRLQKNPRTGKAFMLGDEVKKGEVIIRIVDAEYENNIGIKSKELDLDISKQELDKQKSLYEKGGVTLRELKNAEIKYINTEYDIENARLGLAKMEVVASFDGQIIELPYYTNGTKLKSGTELIRIVNTNKLYLEAQLPEKYYADVRVDMNVHITNYNTPDDTLKGVITQIAPAIDPDARTFKTFIIIDNKSRSLLPGMFVKADLIAEQSSNAIVIPKDIIRGRGRTQTVFVADQGYAVERRINTGIENNDKVQVINGLEMGDRLIVRGYETLKNKSKLKIVE